MIRRFYSVTPYCESCHASFVKVVAKDLSFRLGTHRMVLHGLSGLVELVMWC